MRGIVLADGDRIPVLGQGTWYMAERPDRRAAEIAALRRGLDLGLRLIDTAEMYADGAAEELVGEAIRGRRDEFFIVSKVYPHNAGAKSAAQACERSLKRLGIERLDLYLLHWPGAIPLAETVAAFERLQAAGKISRWGVSNFDTAAMAALWQLPGGNACAVNQVLYNPTRRGIEFDLLPWCAANGVPIMAYSPIEQGRLPASGALAEIATKHGVAPFAVALAWALRHPHVMAIPKMGRLEHVEANARAAELALDVDDLAALDRAFPPPKRNKPLEML